ncbi:fungal antifreeze protein exerts hyperactivity By constructing an inequable beta-helix [Athelia psychrophila]|uniref:Fungal antifreeze protein exerts hyperactivity By constructing an inequable beta-helix n=1 Tax=Athelia psychrophila TaxID=1759441 RepID=A0A167WIZ1_9AGAM|nr:fungal antifreeze protein exerts hyperactivity By constructing an inequable beta-helix [Fibularhizoctonia sp. CBS 109695]
MSPTTSSLAIAAILFLSNTCLAAGPLAVPLGTAANFVILAQSGISTVPTTGISAITGDIGISPGPATGVTGFGLILSADGTDSTSTQITGNVYASSYTSPTPANLIAAVSDMGTAYNNASGRANPDYTELGSGGLGGLTLTPGLYKWSTDVGIATPVTLAGAATDTWIFQIAGDLTIASAKAVILSGGALASNIVWAVAGDVALGTTSTFEGIILSKKGITLKTGATINGRLLGQTAVSLQKATVTQP